MDMRFDRLFKELIVSCFLEFVRLFMPGLYEQMDTTTFEFLDKESFTDISVGERSVADIVVKAKVRGKDSYFLIHVENQATSQPEFAERMFRYFAKLYGKHHMPVYPVAVLSWEKPKRKEPDTFELTFPDLRVVEFHFHAIQLNQLDWRNFLHSDNPVAAALMTRMNVAKKDRPRVKLEALKSIASQRLDPARTEVVSYFVDTILPLDAAEQQEFDERLEAAGMQQKEAIMDMTTSWELRGRERGLAEGMAEGQAKGLAEGLDRGRQAVAETVLKFLRRQVGPLSDDQAEPVRNLPLERLEELSSALLDFHTAEDLAAWMTESETTTE
jgi:predicted transposase YdaD